MAAAVNLRVPALPRTAGCWSQPRSQRSKGRVAMLKSSFHSQRRFRKVGCAKCSRTISKSAPCISSTSRKIAWLSVGKIFRDLVIDSQDRDAEPSPEATACLAKAVVEGVLTLNGWDDSVEQWIARVDLLAEALPEHRIPVGAAEASRSFAISPVKAPQITAKSRTADPQPRSIAPHARTPASH